MGWWRRNVVVLLLPFAVAFALDVAYSVLSTCDAVGKGAREAAHGVQTPEQCSLISGPLFTFIQAALVWIGDVLEHHGEAVIAAFTVVLALSTILLWRATERLY